MFYNGLDASAALHKLLEDGGGLGAVALSFVIYWIPVVFAAAAFARAIPFGIRARPVSVKIPIPLPWFECF
jgi:hypothetical protein